MRNISVEDALRESGKTFLKSVAELRGTKKIKCDLSKLVVPKKRIFYVDFEYINSFHFKRDFSNEDTNHLYLIGVLYEKDGNWLYRSFVPKQIDYMNYGPSHEVQNIRDWIDFMESFGAPYCVMNWSTAEQSMLTSLSKQYNFELETDIDWIDLLKLFKTTINFVCDGMKTYSLKDVAKSMYKLGFINTSWNDNVMNGLEANILLIPNFIKGDYVLTQCDSLSDIINYNEIDCRVMMELFEFVVSIKHNKNNRVLLYG
jgi:predicted RecB family nuclease